MSRQELEEKETRHVMLSYEHSSKQVVRGVRDELKKGGVPLWFDEDNMSGNVFDAMAAAVEQASIIVAFFSQGYMKSPNCRRELEYAARLNKPFIPVRVQDKYRADGWLGLLLGNQLYFDISNGSNFTENLPKLMGEIEKTIRPTKPTKPPTEVVDAPKRIEPTGSAHGRAPAPAPAPVTENVAAGRPVRIRSGQERECRTWSVEDVQNWLQNEGLAHLQQPYVSITRNSNLNFI